MDMIDTFPILIVTSVFVVVIGYLMVEFYMARRA